MPGREGLQVETQKEGGPNVLGMPWDGDVPVRVLRERGKMSAMQAVLYYLCEDPEGPGLSQAEAGRAVSVDRRNVWHRLQSAREALAKEKEEGGEEG